MPEAPSSFLLLVAMPGAPSSFLLLVAGCQEPLVAALLLVFFLLFWCFGPVVPVCLKGGCSSYLGGLSDCSELCIIVLLPSVT